MCFSLKWLLLNSTFYLIQNEGTFLLIAYKNAQLFDFKVLSAWYFGMWHFKMATLACQLIVTVVLCFVVEFPVFMWLLMIFYYAF